VFFIRQETVNAPTQPGTGVISFPFFIIFSKSQSPYILSSITLNHTSKIIAFGCIFSTVRNFGFHIAVIIISAFFVKTSIFFVFELQIVTVAEAFISKFAIGFPTILLLPIITTFFQTTSIL
jgi:hypothetical protein